MWSVANDLRPFYDEKAKDRQVQSGGDVRGKTVVEKIPQPNSAAQSRDEAGAKRRAGERIQKGLRA